MRTLHAQVMEPLERERSLRAARQEIGSASLVAMPHTISPCHSTGRGRRTDAAKIVNPYSFDVPFLPGIRREYLHGLLRGFRGWQRFKHGRIDKRSLEASSRHGGGDGYTNVHIHWNIFDSKSLSDFLHQPSNRTQFEKAIKLAVRNGVRFK